MNLRILLPFQIFTEKSGISRLVAATTGGSFGFLPHRLDCVAALVPGVLIYQKESEDEVFVAVDEGILVKTGPDIVVSVRRAVGGSNLAQLRDSVKRDFSIRNEREQSIRAVMTKLESGFLQRFAALRRD